MRQLILLATWSVALLAHDGPPALAQESAAGAASTLVEALGQLEAVVLANNLNLQTLERQVAEIEAELATIVRLQDSSLSLAGSYAFNPASIGAAGPSPHAVSGTAALSLPIFEGLAAGAQLSSSGAGSLSLSVSPLAGVGLTLAQEEQLEQDLLLLRTTRASLIHQARVALLSYAAAGESETLAADRLELARLEFAETEANVAAGVAPVAELTGKADLVASRATDLAGARTSRNQALASLLQASGMSDLPRSVLMPDIGIDAVGSLVEQADSRLEELRALGEFSTTAREQLALERRSLEKELRSTPTFLPQLSLSLNASTPDLFLGTTPTVGAGLSLQLSGDAFAVEERSDLERQLEITARELAVADAMAALERENAFRGIDTARLSVNVAVRALTAATRGAAQAAIAADAGEISPIALANTELDLREAELALLSALVGLYSHIAETTRGYLLSGPNGEAE